MLFEVVGNRIQIAFWGHAHMVILFQSDELSWGNRKLEKKTTSACNTLHDADNNTNQQEPFKELLMLTERWWWWPQTLYTVQFHIKGSVMQETFFYGFYLSLHTQCTPYVASLPHIVGQVLEWNLPSSPISEWSWSLARPGSQSRPAGGAVEVCDPRGGGGHRRGRTPGTQRSTQGQWSPDFAGHCWQGSCSVGSDRGRGAQRLENKYNCLHDDDLKTFYQFITGSIKYKVITRDTLNSSPPRATCPWGWAIECVSCEGTGGLLCIQSLLQTLGHHMSGMQYRVATASRGPISI